MGLINNKEKQFAGGNWGHPRKWLKRHTKIQDFPEVPRYKSQKRKKKKPWIWDREICPFCKKELQIVGEADNRSIFAPRETTCRYCGATIAECPACKRQTWRSRDDIYKHQSRARSCGFEGR